MTAGRHDAGGERERLLDADAVDDQRRPAPPAARRSLARGQAVGRERRVALRPRAASSSACVAPVDGDDRDTG